MQLHICEVFSLITCVKACSASTSVNHYIAETSPVELYSHDEFEEDSCVLEASLHGLKQNIWVKD